MQTSIHQETCRSRVPETPARGSGLSRRQAVRAALFATLAVWLGLAACATRALPPNFALPATTVTVESIPAHEQRTMQCGPAALASVLNHYGTPLTPDQIASDIYRPKNLGTLNLDLALYPRPLGYSTRWFSGSLDELVAAVDRGQPIIVMVDKGAWPLQVNHFMVVSGYTPDGLVVLAGADQPQLMDWTSFNTQWHKTNFWTLEILPPDTDDTR